MNGWSKFPQWIRITAGIFLLTEIKKIFYPGTTQAQLHSEYQKAAETANVRSGSIFYFSQILQENNYSIFSPRKDLCDVCISFKNGNLSKKAYDYHILLKNETRNKKK